MDTIRIVAAGSYLSGVSGEPPPLKSLVHDATGGAVRRIDRFVELALVGAGRCVGGRTLPGDTATYVSSVRGDLTATVDVLTQLCEHDRCPAPFSFINTVGNAACFHIARCFGLNGRSQFVTSRHTPLETALRLAALDLAHRGVASALVGSTEVCTTPLAAHRERIGVPPLTPVGEGSHWFLLEKGDTPDFNGERALGVLRRVASFPDEESLLRELERSRGDWGDAAVAFGQSLDLARVTPLHEAAGIRRLFDYRSDLPWYDSQTGYGIHRFLTSPPARTLVHLDGDPSGRRRLLVIEAERHRGASSTQPPRDRRIA